MSKEHNDADERIRWLYKSNVHGIIIVSSKSFRLFLNDLYFENQLPQNKRSRCGSTGFHAHGINKRL